MSGSPASTEEAEPEANNVWPGTRRGQHIREHHDLWLCSNTSWQRAHRSKLPPAHGQGELEECVLKEMGEDIVLHRLGSWTR